MALVPVDSYCFVRTESRCALTYTTVVWSELPRPFICAYQDNERGSVFKSLILRDIRLL